MELALKLMSDPTACYESLSPDDNDDSDDDAAAPQEKLPEDDMGCEDAAPTLLVSCGATPTLDAVSAAEAETVGSAILHAALEEPAPDEDEPIDISWPAAAPSAAAADAGGSSSEATQNREAR